MTPILVHIRPFDIAASARIDVRAASALEGDAYGLGSFVWTPALVDRPQMSIEIMSVDLSGRVQAGRAQFTIAPLNAGIELSRHIKWGGAAVKIYSATDLAWPAVTELDGEVVDHSYDQDTGILSITAQVSTNLIEKPLLTLEYDGSGGAGGDAEKRGTLKPAGFGACENIPPVMFDAVNNIGCIDGYGNCTAITKLMEGASDMGASVGDYANYAALAAAIVAHTIPPGRWGTCIAQGLIGLGAPPVGKIGVNATFGSNRLGSMMSRVLTTHAGVSGGLIDTASFTALDTALDFPTHYWTDKQIECKLLLENMARSGNATLLLSFQGKVAVSRAVASSSIATLDISGGQIPRVVDFRSLAPMSPVWRLKARAAQPAQVLGLDEVNYVDDIIDRGAYLAATVYRAGNLVWTDDKASWLYINATPGAGNAPPVWPITSNSYWQMLSPPTSISPSGTLSPIGTFSSIVGNSVVKSGGTNGAYQGGAVGQALRGTAYISAAIINIDAGTGSWETTLALDSTETNFAAASGSISWTARFVVTGAGAGTVYLYSGATLIGGAGVAVTGLNSNSRLALVYDGVQVAVYVGGTLRAAAAAAADTRYWPKVIDYQNTAPSGFAIRDVQFGPWSDNSWASIGGDGRPEDGATLADNRVRNSSMADPDVDKWWGTLTRTAGVAANNDPGFFARTTVNTGQGGYINDAVKAPCISGERMYCSALGRTHTVAAGNLIRFKVYYYKADGAALSDETKDVIVGATTFSSAKTYFDVPLGAASFELELKVFNASGSYTDMAMPRVSYTEFLADVTVSVQGLATVTVPASYTGAVTSTNLALILFSPRITKGGVTIKTAAGTTYALDDLYGVISGTGFVLDNTTGSDTKGDITVAAGTDLALQAGGNLVITVDGQVLPKQAFKVVKELAPNPAGASGKSVSWSSGEMVALNTTSYTTIFSSVKKVTVASGETIYGTAPLSYYVSGVGGVTRTMTMKWQYSVAGANSWNDFAAGIAGSTARASIVTGPPEPETTEAEPGSVAVTQSKASLSPGDYDLRIVAICSATGRDCTPQGLASAEAKV